MRILVVKLSSLGDLFHALPTVHNLRVGLDATIDWVTATHYVELVECFDDVDHVIGFPRKGFTKHFQEFRTALRQEQYDNIIDLQGLMKSAIVARLARGGQRIGPSNHREGSCLFYNAIAGTRNKARHAVDENLDIVRYLRLPEIPPEFPVTFPSVVPTTLQPRVAICPSSRWTTKNWPHERFAAVARKLQTGIGASITLLGGPDDVTVCRDIEAALGAPCENLAGKTSFVQMGGILQNMDLLIANDSGPVHMAVAVDTPTLVIFGPTNPDRTGPFGPRHRIIKSSIPCRPCFSRTCNQPDIPCITGVKINPVFDAARDMLS